MPVDTQQIIAEADKLGQLVAQHPAVERYKQAQRAVSDDPDANRTMSEFERQLESLSRQEASGMPVTDAQRQQLESLQSRIVSNIKVKALNMAQVEFIDLLRRVNQAIQVKVVGEAQGAAGAGGGRGGPVLR
ncbi:MAG TPA: YlbF family regulator [Tepidisphaeraceae bacterium]|nr:YlbF family regulator [Tepidisphaeraceae bacterium]